MRILRYNSPMMVFLSRVADLMILNLLWLICCLPIITAGAATTALYSCIFCLNEKGEQPVIRRFFSVFCADFWKSTALLAVWIVVMVLLLLNCWFYFVLLKDMDLLFRILPMLLVLILLSASSYLFPLQARFNNSFPEILRNAVSLAIAHLPTTVLITLVNYLPVLMLLFMTDTFLWLLALWTFLGFSLSAYCNAYFLKRIFRLHEVSSEPEEDADEKDSG